MCLDIVRIPRKLKADGTGYKIFNKTRGGKIYFSYNVGKKVPLPIGKWINEKDYRTRWNRDKERIITPSCVPYPMGFHVYRNKKLSTMFIYCNRAVISVKFRKACAKGLQGGRNVIVAKEIFIQREVKHE